MRGEAAVRTCCVLGGSGFIGSHLVPRLANAGWEVIVPSRYPARARHLQVQPGVRVVEADFTGRLPLRKAVAGADVVINLIGILNEPGRDGSGFMRVHADLPRELAGACESAGVRRMIHVSALNAGAPEATSHYLRSKGIGEERIRASNLDWTILRPSVVFGPGDGFLNRFAGLLRRMPLFIPLPMPDARFAPVHVDDVTDAVLACIATDATTGNAYPLCGPETYTLRTIVGLVAETLGIRRRIVGLSKPLSRLQAGFMDFVPGKPFSTDNYRSLLLDSVCTADGAAELGLRRRRSLPAYISEALDTAGLLTHYDRYRSIAGRR